MTSCSISNCKVDIDECNQEPAVCNKSEKCVNEHGGYTCAKITTTEYSTQASTTPTILTTKKVVYCPKGHIFSDKTNSCEDINECSTGTHNCDVLERCDNTIGSYHCSRIYGCGTGYTLNVANGLCEDDDECIHGTHNCKQLGSNFVCKNTLGSYRCEPIRKPISNTPMVHLKPKIVKPTVSANVTISAQNPFPSIIITTVPVSKPTIGTTTMKASTDENKITPAKPHTVVTTERHTNQAPVNKLPPILLKPAPTTQLVVPHYIFRTITTNTPLRLLPTMPRNVIGGQLKHCLPGYEINAKGECEDKNECAYNPCRRNQKCLNFNGHYQCIDPMTCKMGYEINESGDTCVDVDECKTGTHKCNPTQICRNYPGFHVCECPPGHQPKFGICEDIDECRMFRPCSATADCINTKGSFKCECKEGFRRNGKTCEEINECNENIGLCEQKCINVWGSYRCSCSPGFHLNSDNRTCTDIDECERYKDKRLCIGTCKNVPGSYTCECPKGYQLGNDGRICKDIDECQQNVCLKDEICLNLKGSFRCYSVKCPENYIKDPEHKTRCKRLQQLCDIRDYECLMMPTQYAYQYLAMVSNLPLNSGPIQIIEIKGPAWFTAKAEFVLTIVDVICPPGIQQVDDTYFQKRQERVNSMTLYLLKPIQGPQEVKIKIQMKFYNGNALMGNNIIYLILVVSEHSF